MKQLTLFIIVILLSSTVFAQKLIPTKQFLLACTNVGVNDTVTHYINAVGEVWQFNGSSFVTGGIYNNSLITLGNADFNSAWPGFNFNWLQQGNPEWSLGLYKITNSKQTDKYFYLDGRDSVFGSGVPNPDFRIYFNNSNSKYHKYLPTPEFDIENGAVIRIWDIFSRSPHTSGLQNYWENALVVTNNGSNHPRLVWGPYPSTSLTINNYRVYRKYGNSLWEPHYTVSASTFEYTDESVTFSRQQAGTDVKYYVKAVYNTSTETSATNTVNVNVQGAEIEKRGGSESITLNEYNLSQNYPNPFNPVTTIKYSIPENSFVSLKIYNVLGKEVKELVSEIKPAGNYEATFDASYLSSGVYVYRLAVTEGEKTLFSRTKQMILLK